MVYVCYVSCAHVLLIAVPAFPVALPAPPLPIQRRDALGWMLQSGRMQTWRKRALHTPFVCLGGASATGTVATSLACATHMATNGSPHERLFWDELHPISKQNVL